MKTCLSLAEVKWHLAEDVWFGTKTSSVIRVFVQTSCNIILTNQMSRISQNEISRSPYYGWRKAYPSRPVLIDCHCWLWKSVTIRSWTLTCVGIAVSTSKMMGPALTLSSPAWLLTMYADTRWYAPIVNVREYNVGYMAYAETLRIYNIKF